jgi:D-sedoheptulose 7-phosphate isomerase
VFDLRGYVEDYMKVLRRLDVSAVARMANLICSTWEAQGTVFCCGNGGSAASASHFMTDLTKLTAPTGRGRRIRTMALTENISAISAIGNDLAYEDVFVEQLKPFLLRGDVVIGLSTSGRSANVLRAIDYANRMGAVTLGVTGREGRSLQRLAQEALVVDSTSVQQIEDATMVAAHLMCLTVRAWAEDGRDADRPSLPVVAPGPVPPAV